MSTNIKPLIDAFQQDTALPQIWLLLKAGTREHMNGLQKGTLYMNSAAYFGELEAEEAPGLRRDQEEVILARINGGAHGAKNLKISLKRKDRSGEIDVTDNATINIDLPMPANVMLFSLISIANDETGVVPSEERGAIYLDNRVTEFGSHVLVFTDVAEFLRRVIACVQKADHLFYLPFFQRGYGVVRYTMPSGRFEKLSLFEKPDTYRWQREFRIILGAHDNALNFQGALELKVGDLTDITKMYETSELVNLPISINRFHRNGEC